VTAVRRAAVLGAGSWGTPFAKVLADAGTDVVLWARRKEIADAINATRHNPDYLPGLRLPDRVSATGDAAAALAGADLVVFAVPAQTLRGNLVSWAAHLEPDATLVSLAKGIEVGTSKRMSEVIVEAAGVPADRVVVVSGPNLAAEIAAEQPTASVIASVDPIRAALVQRAVASRYFRPYTNDDVVGCELGGAVKNVIALAYGMASAMGFGDNTRVAAVAQPDLR
jgi:glycerol-3-phosphate dehydrogenase (NAD(P)+)